MTLREQLQQEIERLPDRVLSDALDLVRQLQAREAFDWEEWWRSFDAVSDDFMVERNQPELQQRESWCE